MQAGQVYHIYNHANGSENLFRENSNYGYFLQQYEKYIYPLVNTYAYCLLPNHFHFLLSIKQQTELLDLPGFQNLAGLKSQVEYPEKIIKYFSNFFNSYTKAYNKKYERRGSLFEKSFKRKPIESNHQFQDTFLYINLNPVKHGFVDNGKDWFWSSFNSYFDSNKESLLERKLAISYFDNNENLKYCLEEKGDRVINMNFE